MTMMGRIRHDLRKRKNIDVYLTIAAAIVVSALSMAEVIPPDKVASVTLAVLAVLALNALITRAILEEGGAQDTLAKRFLADFPTDLAPNREKSDNLYLIGVDLYRTIETSYGAFERCLRRGGTIRVLLTDPEADDAAVDARCLFSKPTTEEIRVHIRQSLRKLGELAKVPGGTLQVRTTRAALKFGLNHVDVGASGAILYVQLYSFQLHGESRPMIRLTHADGEWFDCYRDQAEALWAASAEVRFAPAPAAAPAP